MIGRVFLFIALAVCVFLFVQYFRADSPDGTGEAIADVTVPDLTAEQMRGETAFNTNCASCHGTNAAGKDGLGPPLVHKIYEPSHHGDMAFVLAAKKGVRQHHWAFGSMPPVRNVVDAEVRQIVAYVRALQRANGIN